MTSRLAALGTVAGLALTTVLVTAPAADAAWKTQQTFHGAKVQLCKTPAAGGWRVKVRVDNRNGDHVHHGSIGRTRNGKYAGVQVRAAAGRISPTKSVLYRAGDQLDWGGGEGEGINFGDMAVIGQITRC